MNAATAPQTNAGAAMGQPGTQVLQLKPFVRSATEHSEPFLDQSFALGASPQLIRTVDVPSYGFMRSIIVEVSATGGAGGGAVARADAPFNVLSELNLKDVNGANLFGPIDGFEALEAAIWGAFSGRPDPRDAPDYQAVTVDGNFRFRFRIPVELSARDGLGSLANTNASATYKLSGTVNPSATVYSTAPGTLPTVRVRAWLEAWSSVNPMDMLGQPQAQVPPAHGTTQFWSRQVFNVSPGQIQLRLQRVGNLHRTHVIIARDSSGVRSNAVLPDPFRLDLDSRPLYNETLAVRRHLMNERRRSTAQVIDTGLLVIDWSHDLDGVLGDEMRDQWLPTIQSSRLEYAGEVAAAGTLTVITNDIAPVGDPFL